jgi:putative two-component system response regulator
MAPLPETPTILIVDDGPDNLAILSDLLRTDYTVRAANSGRRALQIVYTDPRPELILLDVMMPEMSGHDVLAALRNDPATRDIPVIFVTAMNADEDELHGLGLGAVDYITKPLRASIVQARVRTQIELTRARRRLADHNQYLEAEVARRMQENLLVQDLSIRALASLAETRDPETGNHILRTREYVRMLAEKLKQNPRFTARLDAATIDSYAMSAPLHDIGKVGIPDHILLKPGKLTPDEWTVMKTHAALGADAIARAEGEVVRPLQFLRHAREIARSHHEKWDGTGYPDGLAGEDIPLSARLMSIADVFDALTTARVYKNAMSVAYARDYIVAQRGRHFDPDVVDAFVASLDAFQEIARAYADTEHGADGDDAGTRARAGTVPEGTP